MRKNSKSEEKARREREIFNDFVRVADLHIEAGSMQSESPPKPDIQCVISGQKHSFELVEITDKDSAKNFSLTVKDMFQELTATRTTSH